MASPMTLRAKVGTLEVMRFSDWLDKNCRPGPLPIPQPILHKFAHKSRKSPELCTMIIQRLKKMLNAKDANIRIRACVVIQKISPESQPFRILAKKHGPCTLRAAHTAPQRHCARWGVTGRSVARFAALRILTRALTDRPVLVARTGVWAWVASAALRITLKANTHWACQQVMAYDRKHTTVPAHARTHALSHTPHSAATWEPRRAHTAGTPQMESRTEDGKWNLLAPSEEAAVQWAWAPRIAPRGAQSRQHCGETTAVV